MYLIALIENESRTDFIPRHGLSLYIETDRHKILFDLGPDGTFLENAGKMDIPIEEVDTVIISHGHYDHAGGLSTFLNANQTAKVYIQKTAFNKHFSKVENTFYDCGIEEKYRDNPRIVLLKGDYEIDEQLSLFTVDDMSKCRSLMNDALYEGEHPDTFSHEQHLIIREKQVSLIMGCGHAGVVNIIEKAKRFHPALCVGGFHLMNPRTGEVSSQILLNDIAQYLNLYPEMEFYTCHCTGEYAFSYLSERVKNLKYLSCKDEIVTEK